MIGQTISHYKISRQLGAGGMGTVYLAHDPRLERDVAIKVLSEDFSLDENYRQRFLTEARSASALNHPNIVTVYEIGSDQDRDFIAMEHIEGQSLKHLIEQGEPLSPARLLDLGIQLASALAAAHRAGVIHRDLKPGNVIMTPEGRAKILDFGLAKRQTGPSGAAGPDDGTLAVPQAASLTEPGMILGTPGYMAPEKARGEEGDHRADLFSLGGILYALATGKAPFSGDSVIDVLHNVIHQEPESLEIARSDLPPALRDAIERCLAKQPRDRYADAGDLEAVLREIKTEMTLGSIAPVSGIMAAPPPSRRRPWLYGVVAVGLVLAGVAGWYLRPGDGVATTTVSVENEEGQRIERQIPVREHRRRMVIFPFESDLADTSRLWLTHAVAAMLVQDLLQDYFVSIDVVAEFEFAREATKLGYTGGLGAPLALKRNTAKNAGATHFVTGRIGGAGGNHELEVQVYATDSGRLQNRFHLEGPDLLGLLDTASREVRRELGVPEQHLVDWPDLPVAEISTASAEAMEAVARASMAFYASGNMVDMRPHLEVAVAADPTYAWAQWALYTTFIYGAEADESRKQEVLEAVMTHIYRLPERLQFAVKANYFQNTGDPEKTLVVLKMWAELYPDDNMALESLVQIHSIRGEREEAFAALRRLIELEPENADYLTQAAAFHQDRGELKEAREYLERLVAATPDDHDALLSLGRLERVLGNHQEARANFDKALTLEPRDLAARLALAGTEFQLGRLAECREILEAALAGPLSPGESLQANERLAVYYEDTGRLGRAIEIAEQARADAEGQVQPLNLLIYRFSIAQLHAAAGNREAALAIVDEVRGELTFPLTAVGALFAMDVYLDLEEPAPARVAADEVEATIEQMKWEHMRPAWLRCTSRILEQEGDPEGALAYLDRWHDLAPTNSSVHLIRARCLRKAGRYEEAQRSIEQALLQTPYNASRLLEAARIAEANGQRDPAIGHLERALEIWREADADFEPAAEARAMLVGLQQTG